MSEKNKALDNVLAMKESLEMTNLVQSNFFANMSHELRNPLNSILGFSQVLLEKYFGPLNAKQERYVKDIHESGQDLLALINDILDLISPDNDNDNLDLRHVNIGDIIRGSLNFIRQKAFKHNIDIRFSMSDDLRHLKMNLDNRKMKQILFNLLSNALNLTPDGGQVGVIAEKLMVDKCDSVVISIIGNRIGMDAESHVNILEESLEAEADKKNHTPHSGLELSLTRSLVELHGGTIFTDRQEGKGNRVTIVLPV